MGGTVGTPASAAAPEREPEEEVEEPKERPKRRTATHVASYAEADVENPYKPVKKRPRDDAEEQTAFAKKRELNPKHVTRDKMASIRAFIEKTQKDPNPFVDHLYKAQDSDIMRFVREFLIPANYSRIKPLLLVSHRCDLCAKSNTRCRRVENMAAHAAAWGYTPAQCRTWPAAGITWHDKSHTSYIFFKCMPKVVWDESRLDAFKVAMESIAWA